MCSETVGVSPRARSTSLGAWMGWWWGGVRPVHAPAEGEQDGNEIRNSRQRLLLPGAAGGVSHVAGSYAAGQCEHGIVSV